MKVSVIIPCLNDQEQLDKTLEILLIEIPPGHGEVIVIDNGSFEPITWEDDPRVKIIRNRRNIGVGGAFNQGVEMAQANKIVLMGCDTTPQEGWFDRVQETLKNNRNTIFSCVSSGYTGNQRPLRKSSLRRFGAHILFKVTMDDLPKNSDLRKIPAYSHILQAKWNRGMPEEEFTPVGCLLGAFYWMYKKPFQKIHGWNGHQMWGSLEPFLSIKARAHGMQLVVDKGLEAAHYYGRDLLRPSRPDLQFYNMLFMAHTMFTDALRDELIEYLRYGDREEKIEKLNVNQARVMIKRNAGLVQAEKNYNNKHFKNGLIANWEEFNTETL
jgi:glycosyltransferase involved in cell wall biosynthesis